MKKYLLPVFVIAASFAASAQSKVDLPLASKVGELRIANEVLSRSGVEGEEQQISVIVTFDSASSASDYAADCSDAIDCRADMVVARLTPSKIEELSLRDDVIAISAGFDGEMKLEVARTATGVKQVQSGTDLSRAYTGKGVIAALYDTGMDPNHANFINGDENRIKCLWTITGNTSAVTVYDTPEKISKFTTDANSETHGTHVLGIMAGSFKKSTRVATVNDRGVQSISNRQAVPYYGVAPDAELAVCCGTFESANTVTAAGLVSDYAKQRGLPAVMNFSLGNNLGPHDGTSATNRYLAELGKDMIICLSAGNEGGTPISYSKTFTASDNSFKTCVGKNSSISGVIDIWSSDSEPVTFTFSAVNTVNGNIPYTATFSENMAGGYRWFGGTNMAQYSNVTYDDKLNSVFGANASFRVSTNVDPINKRYNVYVNLELGAGSNARNIVPVITVQGKGGKTVNMYTKGMTFMSNGVDGCVDGNDRGTISDMACGNNIIAVGSYTNRSQIPSLAGMGTIKATPGNISSFSSYGTTFDGRQLPHIVGPGEGMISSYSYYYIQNLLSSNPNVSDPELYGLAVHHKHEARASYWAEMSGTSMSSPFVAGVIALWLEADPTLTVDDVKNIMKETADNDEFTAVNPERWGYGKINALAGIKKILGSSGIAGVVTDGADMIVTPSEGSVEVFAAGAGEISVELYTVGGALAAKTVASGDAAVLSTDGLAKGVYVLRALADGTRSVTSKIAF